MSASRLVSLALAAISLELLARAVEQLCGIANDRGSADGKLTRVNFDTPRAIAVDRTTRGPRRLFVADGGNGCVRRVDVQRDRVQTIVSADRANNPHGATFKEIAGLAVESACSTGERKRPESLFVVDAGQRAIFKLTPVNDDADAAWTSGSSSAVAERSVLGANELILVDPNL